MGSGNAGVLCALDSSFGLLVGALGGAKVVEEALRVASVRAGTGDFGPLDHRLASQDKLLRAFAGRCCHSRGIL